MKFGTKKNLKDEKLWSQNKIFFLNQFFKSRHEDGWGKRHVNFMSGPPSICYHQHKPTATNFLPPPLESLSPSNANPMNQSPLVTTKHQNFHQYQFQFLRESAIRFQVQQLELIKFKREIKCNLIKFNLGLNHKKPTPSLLAILVYIQPRRLISGSEATDQKAPRRTQGST